MFISLDQLARAYEKLGFVQKPDDLFLFEHSGDHQVMFHSPVEGELLDLMFVIEDAEIWDRTLAEKLLVAIVEILDSE